MKTNFSIVLILKSVPWKLKKAIFLNSLYVADTARCYDEKFWE